MFFDKFQGLDRRDRKFGYAGIDDRGGYFFTWSPTLASTLASIDPDEIDPPRWSARELAHMRQMIRRAFRAEKCKFCGLVPAAE